MMERGNAVSYTSVQSGLYLMLGQHEHGCSTLLAVTQFRITLLANLADIRMKGSF